MIGIDYKYLINSYSDETFTIVKRRFAQQQEELAKMTKNSLASSFLKVLTEQNILSAVTKTQFITIVINLFLDEFAHDRWLSKYMKLLVAATHNSKNKVCTAERAEKYSDWLESNLKNQKNLFKDGTDEQKNINKVEFLTKYLKFTLGISSQHPETCDDKITDMNFDFDENDVSALIKTFFLADRQDEEPVSSEEEQSEQEPKEEKSGKKLKIKVFPDVVKNVAKGASGITNVAAGATAKVDERRINADQSKEIKQFFVLLTWLLFYKIAQEDGIEIGGLN